MVQVKDLTEIRVRDLWREIKDEEDWCGDLKEESLRVVRRQMQSAMEERLQEELRALRRGYRNGYRHRRLLTELRMLDPASGGPREPGRPVPTHHPSPLSATQPFLGLGIHPDS